MVLKNSPKSGGFLGSWEWGEFQERMDRAVRRFADGGQWAQVIERALPFGKKYWFIARGSVFANQKGAQSSSLGFGSLVSGGGLSPSTKYTSHKKDVKSGGIYFGPAAEPGGNRTPRGEVTIPPPSPEPGPNSTDPTVFYHALVEQARHAGALFIRYEPTTRDEIIDYSIATIHISPPTTLLIDLTKPEDELLATMHEKTRYNIRLAERKGVRVRTENPEAERVRSGAGREQRTEFEEFWNLLQETARRDGFRTHNRLYYEQMLKIPWVEFWTAEWDGRVLATGLWACFGDTVTYLHGASSSEHRNVMAPYLLHWEVMREAKNHGFKAYDFWGIQPKVSSFPEAKQVRYGAGKFQVSSSWSGMTRFKTGFGGEVVEYPGTYDLPISKFWYRIYKLARKIRRL